MDVDNNVYIGLGGIGGMGGWGYSGDGGLGGQNWGIGGYSGLGNGGYGGLGNGGYTGLGIGGYVGNASYDGNAGYTFTPNSGVFDNAGGNGVLPANLGQVQNAGNGGNQAAVYNRDVFKQLLLGKTPNDVIAQVGMPANNVDNGNNDFLWIYTNVTQNPVSGDLDPAVVVHFQNGQVTNVNF